MNISKSESTLRCEYVHYSCFNNYSTNFSSDKTSQLKDKYYNMMLMEKPTCLNEEDTKKRNTTAKRRILSLPLKQQS